MFICTLESGLRPIQPVYGLPADVSYLSGQTSIKIEVGLLPQGAKINWKRTRNCNKETLLLAMHAIRRRHNYLPRPSNYLMCLAYGVCQRRFLEWHLQGTDHEGLPYLVIVKPHQVPNYMNMVHVKNHYCSLLSFRIQDHCLCIWKKMLLCDGYVNKHLVYLMHLFSSISILCTALIDEMCLPW